MEIAMGVTELLTGVKWEYERNPYQWPLKKHRPNVLFTLYGTDDILTRIKKLPITLSDDTLEDAYFSRRLRQIKEATLVLRNMSLLPSNAYYLTDATKGLLRDFLCVMLNTPKQPRFNELRNDALDIAEEVTKYMPTASYDPVCVSLYQCTSSPDRAHITRALWAITHFSSEIVDAKNMAMVNVPHHYVANLTTYLLIEGDPDLLNGVTDYFYQYTLDRTNAQYFPRVVNMTINLVPRLVNLLSYEAVEVVEEVEVLPEKIAPASTTIPKVPPELSRQLMALAEPERSSQWLRCCFAEDSDCEITQIALWQAYQMRFGSHPNALAAAEFIKNVSATFTNAQAQVVPTAGPNGQTSTRFIIRGIRPLETALTFDGWPYLYCEWADQPGHLCDRAFADPQELRNHVFIEHTDGEAVEQTDRYNFDKTKQSPKACLWDGCSKYKTPTTEVMKVINHISSHLPQPREPNARPPTPQRNILQPRVFRRQTFRNTPINELREPVGVAYKAALILRNLIVHLPEAVYVLGGKKSIVPKNKLFLARFQTIVDKCCENRSLSVILNEVIFIIQTIRPPNDEEQEQ
jgi:chromatin structure-remodeling complex subunit RSC9